jgi:hypothetical protein
MMINRTNPNQQEDEVMVKQKETNWRRYCNLCQEPVKQTKHHDGTPFGDQYIVLRHEKIRHRGQDYSGYITLNTFTDGFELFIETDGFRMRKRSKVEGNFDIILNHPELIVAIAKEVIRMKGKALDYEEV